MSIEIKVPPLGESVSEATIARWIKSAGEAVALDEPVAELETDKVTLEVPAPAAGVISSITADVGATVGIDAVIALIDEGATASAAPAASAPAPEETKPQDAAPAATPAPAPTATANTDHPLSPAVKRLVEENNLDPKQIPASGKDGRLTKGDVLAAIDAGIGQSIFVCSGICASGGNPSPCSAPCGQPKGRTCADDAVA